MSDAAVLQLEQVHARDESATSGRAAGRLCGFTLAVGPGLHAVLGTPADGTAAFVEVTTGRCAPTSGTVRVAECDPWGAPASRARIAALGRNAELPDAQTAAQAVTFAAQAGGWDGREALELLSIGNLSRRRLSSLSTAALRSVELAVALAVPTPVLVVTFEPFSNVLPAAATIARKRLRERADGGACVVVVTSCPEDVLDWADSVFLLHRGYGSGAFGAAAGGQTAGSQELALWVDGAVGGGARALAAALNERPELCALGWHREPGDPGDGASRALEVVALRAADIDEAALIVAEQCARLGIALRALYSPTPTLERLTAAALAAHAEAAGQAELARAAGVSPQAAAAAAADATSDSGGEG